MKASKLMDAQKAFIIEQTDDGTSVAEVCRRPESLRRRFPFGRRSTLA